MNCTCKNILNCLSLYKRSAPGWGTTGVPSPALRAGPHGRLETACRPPYRPLLPKKKNVVAITTVFVSLQSTNNMPSIKGSQLLPPWQGKPITPGSLFLGKFCLLFTMWFTWEQFVLLSVPIHALLSSKVRETCPFEAYPFGSSHYTSIAHFVTTNIFLLQQ